MPDFRSIFIDFPYTLLSAKFDVTATTAIVAALADNKTFVTAISMHNNDTTSTNDEIVRIQDGSGGTDLYGGSSGSIYLQGRGGVFQLKEKEVKPWSWFNTSTNTALHLNPTNGRRISGMVWYYQR